jgi:hypothetical protein
VRLRIFDLRGRVVETLLDRDLPAGRHTVSWEAGEGAAAALPSGVYFISLEAGRRNVTRSLTLLR